MAAIAPPCLSKNSSADYFLEMAKKWGIFAAITVALGLYIIWFQVQLYHENKENKKYIQQELMSELREGNTTRARLNVTLDRTSNIMEDCTDILKQVHQDVYSKKTQGD